MIQRLLQRLWRPLRFGYLRIMRTKDAPHATALGMAVGVFVGFLPIIPFQTVVALFVAFVIRCGKISAALGTWVSNPFNVPILYYVFYKIGRLVIPVSGPGFDPRNLELASLVQKGGGMAAAMFVGGLSLAIPFSVLTYFLTLGAIRRYHALRARRLKSKRDQRFGR